MLRWASTAALENFDDTHGETVGLELYIVLHVEFPVVERQ